MRSLSVAAIAVLAVLSAACPGQGARSDAPAEPEPAPSASEIVEELAAPLVEDGWTEGLVVGWVAGGERGVVGLGTTEKGEGETPDADTLFEIGSITKAFTGMALAAMVERGEVALDTPVNVLLGDVEVPEHEEGPITLAHLATHTSGLPRLPGNLEAKDSEDPYADYGRDDLAAFFEDYEPSRAPGSGYDYSNLGMGLLGEALAARAETSYEDLVTELVLAPLGMDDTAIRLTAEQAERLATGYAEGEEVPAWTFDALAGAGALRSSADDLLTLIESHFSAAPDELAGALENAREARVEIPGGDWVALGWHVGLEARKGPPAVVWHNGGTGGFHSFLAFDPEREIGVVVLANSLQPTIERLGIGVLRLLRGEPPNFQLPRLVEMERDQLRRYEGVYQLAPGVDLAIVREGDKLLAQLTGQPLFPIFPSSETEFFYRVVDARIEFHLSDDGEVEGLTLHQDGESYEAPRTSSEPPPRLNIVEVEIDRATLDRYVGRYEINEELRLEIERRDGELTAQVTGQPALVIVPTSQTEFVYRDVDAQLTFVVDDDGEVTGVVLRQAGREVEAPKID